MAGQSCGFTTDKLLSRDPVQNDLDGSCCLYPATDSGWLIARISSTGTNSYPSFL
jgi:hypothetical protein